MRRASCRVQRRRLRHLTRGIGPDRVIDAVGVDANRPHRGPAERRELFERFESERREVAPEVHPVGGNWEPGDAPSQAIEWAVDAVAKAGTVAVIGVYPESLHAFPLGQAMNKNLTVNMGNCNHRKYVHQLIDLVASGQMGLAANVTHEEPFDSIIDAYRAFDRREPGWIKVAIELAGAPGRARSSEAA